MLETQHWSWSGQSEWRFCTLCKQRNMVESYNGVFSHCCRKWVILPVTHFFPSSLIRKQCIIPPHLSCLMNHVSTGALSQCTTASKSFLQKKTRNSLKREAKSHLQWERASVRQRAWRTIASVKWTVLLWYYLIISPVSWHWTQCERAQPQTQNKCLPFTHLKQRKLVRHSAVPLLQCFLHQRRA